MKWCLTLATAVAIAFASPVSAQNVRSFVSGQGSDANPCTLSQPCRSFAATISQTNTGGEIDVLDPAGYGPLKINKSISIQGHGFSGITDSASGTSAIQINDPSAAVYLSGLIIDGAGTADIGIEIGTATSVTIKDCSVRNFVFGGIIGSTGAIGTRILLADTIIADDNLMIGIGFVVQAPSHAVLSNVRISGQEIGVNVNGNHAAPGSTIWLSINDSLITGTNNGAIVADNHLNQAAHQFVTVSVTRSSIVDNGGTAIISNGLGTVVELNQTSVVNNASGWSTLNNGAMLSWGNNNLADQNASGDSPMPLRALQ